MSESRYWRNKFMDDYEAKTASKLNPLTRTDFLSYPEICFFGTSPEDLLIKTIEETNKYYNELKNRSLNDCEGK